MTWLHHRQATQGDLQVAAVPDGSRDAAGGVGVGLLAGDGPGGAATGQGAAAGRDQPVHAPDPAGSSASARIDGAG